MPFEVVLAQIEKDRHPGRHRGQKLGLEARYLEHPTLPASFEDELRRRGTEVAAGHRRSARCNQHLCRQLGHRALAVGAGHGHQLGVRPMEPRKLDLGVDFDAAFPRRLEQRCIGWDTGRGDDQPHPLQAIVRVAAKESSNVIAERRQLFPQLARRTKVGCPDLGTVGSRETSSSYAGASQPDNQHPWLVVVRHSYLSFRVDSPARAKTTAMIQKRTTTWVSVQPRSSKW